MHRPTIDRILKSLLVRTHLIRAFGFALPLAGILAGASGVNASLFSFLYEGAAKEKSIGTAEVVADVGLLRAARHIDPNPARGGGGVVVEDGSVLVSQVGPQSLDTLELGDALSPDNISLYVVQEGDTVSQVAEMFGVSVNTIVWANELRSSKAIHPGMTLVILPISGVQHEVRKGDTLASITKKYGGDIDEVRLYNDLSTDVLVVGSTITVPGGEIHTEKPRTTATKETSGTSGSGVVSSGTNGYYSHPLPGSVRTQGLHGYNAVDFGAPAGTPIRAAAGGQVIVSRSGGWNGGYGNYVVIDHANGTQTLYAHLSKNAIAQGQSISQGQVIGYVGSTGRSTGNHLHFEVRGARNPF